MLKEKRKKKDIIPNLLSISNSSKNFINTS